MTASELRQKFLKFFESKRHKIIPSAPLVPENDPTVLFTTAGMHPLVPYLLGQSHPLGNRLCNVQKCVRTVDIDEVGDSSHLTFFEMLGNWSLGDYFKKEAIEWSFEFLTKELGLAIENLAISVFKGEKKIPKDKESAEIWEKLGIPKKRIAYLGKEDNWWGPAGQTGPCGPDTEMFYWTGEEPAPKKFNPKDEYWVEIWNNVFMQFNKTESGEFAPLAQKNVDTGMGLERMIAVLQKKDNVYETELFSPLIETIKSFSGKKYETNKKAFRIIADHLKAAVFILAEGVEPSNIERGYVLRKLIRRAVKCAWVLDIEDTNNFFDSLISLIIDIYKNIYNELVNHRNFITEEAKKEINDFSKKYKELFENSVKEYSKSIEDFSANKTKLFLYKQLFPRTKEINGREVFEKYQEQGGVEPEFIRMKMEEDMTDKQKKANDSEWQRIINEFNKAFLKHQELSRTASVGKFKAGLADNSEQVVKYHTATHLLHSALRKILGEGARQMGSNITAERLRFDFSFERKMTGDEIKKVENLINQKINENLEVKKEEMPLNQALESGASAFFREKYPEKVSVYSVGDFSKEICGGPHVSNIGNIGKFKIIKEEASSRGIRRIKAVLE